MYRAAYSQALEKNGSEVLHLLLPVPNAKGLWGKALKTLLIEIKPVKRISLNQ